MNKKAYIFLITFLISLTALSQQLVINEVSQGPSGNKEYVELVVVGSPTCNGIPTMDLRGYYIDDNNGTFAPGAGTGIAPGCVRFQNIPFWSAIPYGTIIVIHNDADVNASVPANDLSMVDGNCLLIIPVSNNTLLERHTTLPTAGTPAYPVAGFVAGGNWTQISMANADDSFQTRNAAGVLEHAVSWNNNNASNIIYFTGTAGGFVMLNTNITNTNPATQSNWTKIVVAGNETPGAPNNAANAAWISSMNNGCAVIQPFGATTASTNPGCTCNGLASISPTGAIAPYTYTWAPSGGNLSSASALCAGVYTVTSTSSNNCTLTATYTLTSSGALTTATAATQPACFGSTGSATITPSGVAGPFTYTWTPSVSSGSTASGLTAGNYTVSVGAGGCTSTRTITIASPPASITINTSVTQPNCTTSTGSGSVTVSGGPSTTYGYAWNPSASTASTATGLAASTNQTITVTSGACTNSAVIAINAAPIAIVVNTSATQPNCTTSTGLGTVTASGGTGAYTYAWNPSASTASTATGLAASTNQTITVTSGACTNSAVIAINAAPIAIVVNTSVTQPACFGGTGTATITASGGTGAFSYAWNPSASTASTAASLGAGTQTITVTSGACTNSAVVTITAAPAAITINTSVTQPNCITSTGSGTVTASGGPSTTYSYAWNPSASTASNAVSLGTGTQTITVTSGVCTNSAVIIITAAPAAITINTSVTQPACFGGTGSATVTASGGAGAFTYAWSPSASSASTAASLGAGTQTITVTSGVCTNSALITVTAAPSAITINTTVAQPPCFGFTGSATVTASGGPSSAYSYAWIPSASTASTSASLGAGTQTITVSSGVCTNSAVINVVVPSSLTIVANTTSVLCTGASNGSGTVTVTGGAGGYSYLWSSGFTTSVVTGQAAGNLTVTVSDANGCTSTRTLNIAQPAAALTTATAVTNVLCNGATTGAATITANGGTTPYNYLWSSGATTSVVSSQPASVLSVTVTDANGCTSTKTVTISQPATALSTNTTVINVLCNGAATGAATISAVGGTTPYNYLWSSGATSSVVSSQNASVLTVTVTDANGCTSTKTVNIIQPSVLTTAIAGASIACNGNPTGSATITAIGGAGGYSYLWSSGFTNSVVTGQAAGNLTVTVSDANGCISTQTINISQPATALTSNTTVSNVLCNGAATGAASITANGGTNPYNYLWSSGATSSVVTGQVAGVLTVTVTDANGCTSSQNVTISQPASALTTNTFVTNVLCNGASTGAASITANGGTVPYNYLWSSGATSSVVTGQVAGFLTVTVTDANGCTSSQNVTISQPAAALSIAITSTNAACGLANGSASATVNGGTAGYSYTWSPTGGNSALASSLFIGNYSVSVNDANGCSAIQTVTITQPNSMTVTLNSTSVTCNGGNNGTANANVIGVTGPYTYTWNPAPGGGQGTTNVSGLSAQIYTLTVADNLGCTTLTNVAITQPAVALAGVTSATNVSCFGGANGSASVSASGGTAGYSYTWSPSGGNTALASGLTAGNYSVTIADANNCTVTVNAIIGQPISALAGVISTTDVLCFGGSTGSASVSASGGTSGYNYSWSPSGGSGALASGLVAGNYSVTITDANNCTFTVSTTITQPIAALNIVTSTTNASCGFANGSASASVSGGTGAYSYTWSPAGGNLALTSGIAIGNYTVTVQDANNCFAMQTATVIQPNSMTVTLNSTSVTCNGGNNATAIANVIGSVGPYTYTWNPAPGGGQNTSNVSGLSAQIYTLTVTDNLGCNTQTNIAILQPTGLSAIITTTAINCFGNATGAASVSASGGSLGYTYTWTPSGGNGTIASSLIAGNYTVTITDANNCSITTSANVTQPANSLSATINSTNVLCFGGNSGSASLNTNGGTASYNYTWAPTGGNLSIASNLSAGTYTAFITDSRNCTFSITTSIAQPTANLTSAINNNSISCFGLTSGSASVSPNGGTGAYTFTWLPTGGNNSTAAGLGAGSYTAIINDANNCSFSVSTTISQGNPITVNVNPIQICNGQNGTLNGTINGGEGPYTYIWNGTSALNPFSVSPSATTVYSLSVVDNKGCVSNVDTALVLVSAPLSLNVSPSKTICTNASATLSANGSGGLGNYQYYWMPLNTNGQTIVITPTGTSVYSVTVSDNCSQPVTLTTTITVESVLSSTLLASNYTGCSPLCVDFNNSVFTSSANILTSTWNFGDGSITTGLQNTHCFTRSGTFSVTNTYATLAGCVNTVTLATAITVSLTPVADFYVSNPQFTYFTPDVLFQNVSLNATSYFWDFSGIGTSTLTQPSFSFYEPGKYLIALIAKNGSCSDTILKTIDCLPEFTFYAPNAFTPNADGLNERFLPLGEGWVKDTYVLRIFDRWGEQIFHTAEWDLGWNGKKNGVGNIVKDDIYVWKVNLKDIFGKQREFIGHIEVLK